MSENDTATVLSQDREVALDQRIMPLTLILDNLRSAFDVGNEALGIAEETPGECHGTVALPVYGRKNSINVGNSAAVVMYEARRQWTFMQPSHSQSWSRSDI